MKIAICEDDEKQRDEIKKICDDYFAGISQAYEYNEYADGETLLEDESADIDLLFLDIDLGTNMDGIAVMNELEKSNCVKKILFISSHHQAVWDSFGWKTLGFVRKPIEAEEVLRWLGIVSRELIQNQLFEFCSEKGTFVLACHEIEAIEAEGNYVRVLARDEDLFVSGTLKHWLEKMQGTNVIQVHRSFAVNLENVDCLGNEIVLKNGKHYPIGRSFKKTVQEKYKEYIITYARNRIQ